MSHPWKELAHRCLEEQLRQLHDGSFDPKTAIRASPESSWNSFVCSTALSILHQYVDALYFTSPAPTDFCRIEKIFLDAMMLDVHPEVRGDRLFLFGQSKPCVSISRLQQSLGGSDGAETRHCAIADATACHEVRLCVLLAALAICQMSLASQYARGFSLMVKATLGEVRAARVHATSETVQRIAHALGEDGRALDMVDRAFDSIAQHSLQKISAANTPRGARAGPGGGCGKLFL